MQQKSVFDQMPPRFAFWAGVVTATAVISVVALIVMTSVVLGDGETTKKSNTNRANTNAAANVNAAAAPTPTTATSFDTDVLREENIRGEGDITVVEFSDTECPYCSRFHETMKQVVEEYDGQVRWAYHHFPLNIHPAAPRQAEATECAADQGAFWEYTDAVFEGERGIGDEELIALAGELGLDQDEFTTCLENDTYADRVDADAAYAQQLGGQGTPFSLVIDENGEVLTQIPGALPFESVSAALDGLL